MNPDTSSPTAPDAPTLPPRRWSAPPVHLPRIIVGLFLAVAVSDLCFWHLDGNPGLSVAVFFAALGVIILGNRESSRGNKRAIRLLVLLFGAVVAAAIETGITNTLVLLLLIVALAGETFFVEAESPWGRWLSQVVALIFAPGRVFWLGGRLLEVFVGRGVGWTGGVIGGCLLAIPALVLALIFGSLLATGNAVFGSWTNSFFDWFWKEVASLFDFGRIVFWCFAAFLILPLLRPAQISSAWWSWTEKLPRFPEVIPARGALFGSGLVLVVLNLLFLLANAADAVFLWSGQALPAAVSYSGFVHNGVNALIVTVILSGFVLTTIFQQALNVSQRRELKALGIFWIAQNLFLLLSVAMRLKLYIEAYDMTVTRLSVIIFLMLVAVGYGLLSVKIVQEKSLSWLVGGCLLAIFVTFYITQFLNLAGWSADYNVARWEKDKSRSLDGSYLGQLGSAAWPAIHRAEYENPSFNADAHDAWNIASMKEINNPKAALNFEHWREFSLSAYLNRWALEEKPNN